MMIPQIQHFGYLQDVDRNKYTLITSFSSERDQWMRSKCINIHDPDRECTTLQPNTMVGDLFQRIFSRCWSLTKTVLKQRVLGLTGHRCRFDTRGLLQRTHVVANWPPVYIGKESNKHWEEGEDLSLLEFRAIEYKRKGYATATDEQLARIGR